ncbi:MAG TPA: LacI family DNA-binding transcriptional regulator [Pyrinomonadaceae bacterium]|jgi:LacI family transcriptional regulator, galactose operon repressor|nr:LacI family DNA-binding transcriptional regulator [Pyrinomonadaceae bacterium]
MPTTLADIARALGVSKMTVSRAINNHSEISPETRARILEAAQRMNYRPNQFARALTTNRSYLLGVVVPDLMHSYFAEICRGIESVAKPLGYQNLICSTDEDAASEEDEIGALLPRTDGLIVASSALPTETKFYRRLTREHAKLVLIDRQLEGVKCPMVTTDDVKVGLLATNHLIGLGHRRVGHLKGTAASTAQMRFEGYKKALLQNRIPFDASLVRECGFTEGDGYRSMKEWLATNHAPSAIFAANDPAAIGAMTAINEGGLRIPDDVAIVGGGNIHYGDMLRVPLTTVAWSTSEMGQNAARLLVAMVEGKKRPKETHIIVEPELVVRESCGTARAVTA